MEKGDENPAVTTDEMTADSIIDVKGLSFTYEGSRAPALRDISFSAMKGEFITICGPSGCGKSTLLRQLKSCLTPQGSRTGDIYFTGRPLEEADGRSQTEGIGFVMQSPEAQCVTDRVWHELAFTLESLGMKREPISRRIAETAAFFGIEELLDRDTSELSGGQKQMIALASVMTVQPKLLLLDEPTSQLDPVAAFGFISLLGRINRELSTTVIICEHSLGELLPVSSRVIVMSGGSIVCSGEPSRCAPLLYEKRDPSFLSFPAAARIACYAGLTDGNEAPLSITEGRRSLEEAAKKRAPEPLPVKKLPSDKKPCVSIKNLYFRYSKDSPDVLRGLSLDIYGGEQLCILGGNGSGKTTLLNIISGAVKQYSGKIKYGAEGGIAYMPQEPSLLFVKSTVLDELYEVQPEDADEIEKVIALCGLGRLLERHPFDISGGEAQRLALAKLLLTKPRLLLLDEPSKGLDSADKRRLADIINTLRGEGAAVVTVTHDTDFAAEYSQRCAMLFNGRIVSCDTPRGFFTGSALYTTESARIARDIIPNAVTVADVMSALGRSDTDDSFMPPSEYTKRRTEAPPPQPRSSRRHSPLRAALGAGLLAVFAAALAATADILYLPLLSEFKAAAYILLFISAGLFILISGGGRGRFAVKPVSSGRLRSALAAVLILIAVPLTAVWGVYLLDGTRYVFISLLILFESMAAYRIILGSRQLRTRELVVTALLCALCVAGRAAFYMLPACKPVTAIVIITAVSLGSETGFLTGMTSMLLSNIFFGQGVWTPWQMLAMGLIGYITGLLFHRGLLPASRISLSLWGGFAAFVIYGGIMDPTALIFSGTPISPATLAAVYAAGLPINTVHAVSSAVFVYMFCDPLIPRLERLKTRYGVF